MAQKRLVTAYSVLVLATALSYYGVYTFPLHGIGHSEYWTLVNIAGAGLAFLFVALPIFAFAAVLRGWRGTFVALGLWPLVAFLFGVVPVPFGHVFYSSNVVANTIIIAVVNTLAIVFVVWLYSVTARRSNSTLHRKRA